MWGIANSNYAGTMGLHLNPASIVNSYIKQEIHIFSGDIFLNNNYIYIREGTHPITKMITGQSIPDEDFLDDYTTEDKFMYSNVQFKFPGFYYSKKDFGFALNFGMRENSSINDFPYHLAKFFWDGFNYSPQHGQNFSSGSYTVNSYLLSEISLTLGKNLLSKNNHELNGGITIQPTFGHIGASIVTDFQDYIVPNSDTLFSYQLNSEYSHAIPNFGSNGGEGFNLFKVRGTGIGGSIGIKYTNYIGNSGITTAYRNRRIKSYNYKLGFSLIDVGFTSYKKEQTNINFTSANVLWDGISTVQITSVAFADSLFSSVFAGGTQAIDNNKAFKVFLPMAISTQFDYSFNARFFAAANFITSVPLNTQTVRRPTQLSITPRYETPDFEVSLPYSLYRMKDSRLGLAARYKWFVLGTDMLGPWLGNSDFYGFDLYFGFKVSSYPNSKARNRRNNPCPAFE